MTDKLKRQVSSHRKGRLAKSKDHRMVHTLVRKIAWEMAAVYYEHAAGDNAFYHHYPSQKFFADYEWRRFIKHAKDTMLDMLDNPLVSETYKPDIYHALLLDATLPYAQMETQMRPN
jgi:hypothetical protein